MLHSAFVELGATASDNCSLASFTTNNTVNTAVLGSYTNTFVATDAAGNSATNHRIVHVVSSFVWTNLTSEVWSNGANWLNDAVANGTDAPAN